MSQFDPGAVRDYYDRHTGAFVGFGEGRHVGAIHRAVWGPGVYDLDSAMHYVDDRILEIARALPQHDGLHLVDLGCGVAASLCYLMARLGSAAPVADPDDGPDAGPVAREPGHRRDMLPGAQRPARVRGTGITLSPAQVRLARANIIAAGLQDRLVCLEGDYTMVPPDVPPADVAFAIESFVHAPSAAAFLDQCRRLVRPGGALAICDDFRSGDENAHAARAIAEFRRGWHVNSLLRLDQLATLAGRAGFVVERTEDLSPFVRIHRWRDRAIDAFLTALGWLRVDRSRFDDLVGGRALQTCLSEGWIRYELVVLRRLDRLDS
jgi:SAM-dependent methyltransferase